MEHLSKHDIGSFRTVCVAAKWQHFVKADLEASGFASYSLEAKVIRDKESFLAELANNCNLVIEPTLRLTSWDLASDLLWQMLMAQSKNKVAIYWQNAHEIFYSRMQLLLDCMEFFNSVADIVERQEPTANCHPVLLRIVLFGDGSNFGSWS